MKHPLSQMYKKVVADKSETLPDGSSRVFIKIEDIFSDRKYSLERKVIYTFSNILNNYLRKRPELSPDSKKNIAKRILYIPKGFRSWSEYMPGGIATYHVYDPRYKHMLNGTKLDFITKRLFRHAIDGRGLRSRSYAMTWFALNNLKNIDDRRHTTWLSIASGTGKHVFDGACFLNKQTNFIFIDQNKQALDYSLELAKQYDVEDRIETDCINVVEHYVKLAKLIDTKKPNIIDAMGFIEYLPDKILVGFLHHVYKHMQKGSVFIFTNMLETHPHLDLHQRGVGWPGVRQRSQDDIRQLAKKAGIDMTDFTIMLPDDGAYGVYGVVK